ncbi:MAG: sporulation protein YabP [Clostridia bacterium]|nr:sporulation protein YabP [Clostridia bacterium]
MQTQDKNIRPKMPHNVIMEGRKKISVTGVLDIDSFNEQGVIALTEAGILIIKGIDVRINKLNVENGDVSIEAKEIISLTYTDVNDKKASSIIKNLFK